MKLYYTPGACSLSPHIALREAGITPELILVDLKTKQAADGRDFLTINPKGYVPALETDKGEIVTEGVAIGQYITDIAAPTSTLAPKAGTMERIRLQEWLTFINSEVHKGFIPLFNENASQATKDYVIGNLKKRLGWTDEQLKDKTYLLGETFTVADAYLFTVVNWAGFVGLDISSFANLGAFMARVGQRPAVQAALKAEGLIK